jgi:hypothetical protein
MFEEPREPEERSMRDSGSLCLHHEIMLLALRDREGTIASGTLYQFAIGGAVLAELLLHTRISIGDQKKKLLQVADSTLLNEPLLDECLARIAGAKRRASLQTWVSRIAGMSNLKHRVATQLCERGILRADEDKVLLIFSRKIYPEVDSGPETSLIERLRSAIFDDDGVVDPRTVVLVSLADGTGLLKVAFGKRELEARKRRIDQIVNGELTGKATREAVEAMQAAVIAACVIPTLIATTH